jgi:hypothetical protein
MERFQPAAPFMKVDSSWVNSATAATSRPRLRFGTSNVIERRRAISRRPIFGDEMLWHKWAIGRYLPAAQQRRAGGIARKTYQLANFSSLLIS